MNEKIEYNMETKDGKEKNLQLYEENINKELEDDRETLLSYKNDKHTKSDFYYVIHTCVLMMKKFIKLDRIDDANNAAETGIELLKKYEKYADDYLHLNYEMDWLFNKKENTDFLIQLINDGQESLQIKLKKGCKITKPEYIFITRYCLQAGQFEKAREYIKNVYEVKPRSRLNEDVIYHLERFYAFVCEYLCEPEKNKDMLSKLTKCFKILFDEVQNGNKHLYEPNVINPIEKDYIFYLRLIWYKYFSGRDWNTVTFEEIVKSERYGIKGLQDC